eukprot:TRINITY_DN573_c0_g1_i1.p1 TRINITY_DN573_c0_g1~~TRINITY_DN573_c0_g1_i1.p1  ORF type:complete len:107 (-),score=38.68 TRINITY_DN573_c0_g1_i1:92-412(-)
MKKEHIKLIDELKSPDDPENAPTDRMIEQYLKEAELLQIVINERIEMGQYDAALVYYNRLSKIIPFLLIHNDLSFAIENAEESAQLSQEKDENLVLESNDIENSED